MSYLVIWILLFWSGFEGDRKLWILHFGRSFACHQQVFTVYGEQRFTNVRNSSINENPSLRWKFLGLILLSLIVGGETGNLLFESKVKEQPPGSSLFWRVVINDCRRDKEMELPMFDGVINLANLLPYCTVIGHWKFISSYCAYDAKASTARDQPPGRVTV